jgi:hypothetical protein
MGSENSKQDIESLIDEKLVQKPVFEKIGIKSTFKAFLRGEGATSQIIKAAIQNENFPPERVAQGVSDLIRVFRQEIVSGAYQICKRSESEIDQELALLAETDFQAQIMLLETDETRKIRINKRIHRIYKRGC